ncbi:GPI transamidase subunit PIG-U [Phytophthora cactorum]|nr:GPI transamidase subunit PIG-U [Phytophthora cactorum]
MPRLSLLVVLLLGACVRGLLYAVPSVHATLSTRPELATSISSFRRLEEGVFLFQSTGSPYAGDVYHQPPLLFALLYPVLQVAPASSRALAASMMCVAAGTYLSVYPFFLMVPIVLLLRSVKESSLKSIGIKCLVVFGVWLGLLFYLSWNLTGGWEFLEETYAWVAKYSDLTPNIGIFWYFFMEVFDRFIPYFLFVMHLHPVIYVVPIYLRLAHRPQAYACALIGIFSLFQAYPSFGDFGFFLSMLALHPKTIMTIENRFVYVLGLGVATCMLPVMWFLWLFPASGNANFFYNQTLVYQIFNTQIITAFVGATMKRDKDVDKYRTSHLKERKAVDARE